MNYSDAERQSIERGNDAVNVAIMSVVGIAEDLASLIQATTNEISDSLTNGEDLTQSQKEMILELATAKNRLPKVYKELERLMMVLNEEYDPDNG